MEENEIANSGIALSKFVNKAKRKLNGDEPNSDKPQVGGKSADYSYKKSDRNSELKKLEAQIKQLLKTNPNSPNPIGQLIDHKVFDSLDEHGKSRYVLTLSKMYNQVLASMNR